MDAKLAAMSEEELKAFKEGVTQRRTPRRGDKLGKRQKQLQVGKQHGIRCCGTLAAAAKLGLLGQVWTSAVGRRLSPVSQAAAVGTHAHAKAGA